MTPLLLTTVGIFNENNELLLVKRSNNPFKGLFSLPGGKLEEGELVADGAIREIREELGIDISSLIKPIGYKDLTSPGRAIVFIFVAKLDSHFEFKLQPEEISELTWVTPDGVVEVGELPPNHKDVLEFIYKRLSNNKI